LIHVSFFQHHQPSCFHGAAPLMLHASKNYISRSNLDCGSGIFFGGKAGRAAT
jgi:hypothetical protein